jgi:hypothetical protein
MFVLTSRGTLYVLIKETESNFSLTENFRGTFFVSKSFRFVIIVYYFFSKIQVLFFKITLFVQVVEYE